MRPGSLLFRKTDFILNLNQIKKSDLWEETPGLILSTFLTGCHSFGMATFNKHGCAHAGSSWGLFCDCHQKTCDVHSTCRNFCN